MQNCKNIDKLLIKIIYNSKNKNYIYSFYILSKIFLLIFFSVFKIFNSYQIKIILLNKTILVINY